MKRKSQIFTIEDYLKARAHPLRQVGGRRSSIRKEFITEQPLVTVITIVRNRKETLPKTITSVLNQSYPNIEHVIIDGASTDDTLEIIKQFNDKIDLWISEPDCGTSDAFNKAVSRAQGDFIFGLASDDWIDFDFIEKAVRTLLKSGADFVFGDMVMYENGDPVTICKSNKNYSETLMSGYPRLNFPTMVIKRESFQEVGLIDMSYGYIADYEWTLRLLRHGGKGFYNGSLLVHRRIGGLGESHSFRSVLEHLSVSRQYGLPVTKAVAAHLYYFARRAMGRLARLLLPGDIYTKLKRAARGSSHLVEP